MRIVKSQGDWFSRTLAGLLRTRIEWSAESTPMDDQTKPRIDFQLKHSQAELDSTGYMELGPGKYDGSHWQAGFVFVWSDAFGIAEGIVEKHFPAYDHMGMNDIQKEVLKKIITEWRAVADRLPTLDRASIPAEMNLVAAYYSGLVVEIDSHRLEVSGLLRSLANECERFIQQNEWVCILGM